MRDMDKWLALGVFWVCLSYVVFQRVTQRLREPEDWIEHSQRTGHPVARGRTSGREECLACSAVLTNKWPAQQ